MVRILAFAGSSRTGSYNQRLLQVASQQARTLGAEVNHLDLRDLNLPIMDQDLELDPGPPKAVAEARHLMIEHDGFLVACPEYNGSITPLLKNFLDWMTRPEAGVPPLAAFQGKTATLLAASAGGLGGIRGLAHVRDILSGIEVCSPPMRDCV
ncbi:MAG TPA: NAD(P)H-dependent oxidoreductase, partial [Planctomycetota bacterium]|nr:NAD(P)H-dependent oxidoreductase [Planctomycetota bacterium]